MGKYINSNQQVLAHREVNKLDLIIEKDVRTSGMFDAFNMMNSTIQYSFDEKTKDYIGWEFNTVKAIAEGTNQAMIGQTVYKDAYHLAAVDNVSFFSAGIFTETKKIVNDNFVEAEEIRHGKVALNQLWREFDMHILGTVTNTKINNGLLDYISTIDNTIFGANAIVNSFANRQKIYNILTGNQASINTSNGNDFQDLCYVVVSGSQMLSMFTSPYNDNGSSLSTLEDMLLQRGIVTIYLSNQSDTRDYAMLIPRFAFSLYYGILPYRKSRLISVDTHFEEIKSIWYSYTNPFLVPKVDTSLGMIVNGGSTGINGGVSLKVGAKTQSKSNQE